MITNLFILLCYNTIRRAGRIILPLALCLLMAVPSYSQNLTIPTTAEYLSWDSTTQRAFDWKLGGINTLSMIQAGELVPGQSINLSLPPVDMTVQLYRWTEYWSAAQRQSSVDYQELLQWRRFYDAVEKCDKWLDGQRKFGGIGSPMIPYAVDLGYPDVNSVTQYEYYLIP